GRAQPVGGKRRSTQRKEKQQVVGRDEIENFQQHERQRAVEPVHGVKEQRRAARVKQQIRREERLSVLHGALEEPVVPVENAAVAFLADELRGDVEHGRKRQ